MLSRSSWLKPCPQRQCPRVIRCSPATSPRCCHSVRPSPVFSVVSRVFHRSANSGKCGPALPLSSSAFSSVFHRSPNAGKRGVFRQGDTGCYTERGDIYVLGRTKDQFKCKDQQVAPSVLEEVILEHPDVCEAVVAGVPHDDLGEAARAFIVLRDGVHLDNAVALRIKKFVKGSLPFQRQLRGGVEFLQRLPTTETGKNLRRALRDAYMQTSEKNILL